MKWREVETMYRNYGYKRYTLFIVHESNIRYKIIILIVYNLSSYNFLIRLLF